MKQNIGIVGLGLIGASLAMAIKQNTEHNVYGLDINEQTMHRALEEGSIDGVLEDYSALDLLIVALFPQAAVELILDKVEQMKPGSIVMDICGVKKSVVTQVAQVCKSHKVEFIGGHPMAGTQFSGFKYSDGNLFHGAPMVIVPKKNVDMAYLENVKRQIEGKEIVKVIVVPNRLINIVVKG